MFRKCKVLPLAFLAIALLFLPTSSVFAQDCTGTAASPCHYCDVNTFQFKLRDPYDVNDSRGWVALAFVSGACTTCTTTCTEIWTKASDYNFCAKEGVYDIKAKSYNQGVPWFWTESDWNIAYTVDWDNDSSWCACKGGTWISAATYCGSLGCQGGKCCGDDNSNDTFCASGSGSCVNGTYYANHCTDGVQNCDETSVDVGGADCWANCTGTHPVITNSTEEATFTASGEAGVGVLAADGNYLYVKRWGSYPGDTTFTKIGSGYGGTTAGTSYGNVGSAMQDSLTAFYLDGYIYNGYTSNGSDLQRVNVSTGAIDYRSLGSNLLARGTGLTVSSATNGIMVTTNGDKVYSVAYSINNGGYNGFTIREYKASDFSYVRQFTGGSSSFYVDGIMADRDYIYMIQWVGSFVAATRKVKISDGTITGTDGYITQNNASDDPISGQYDWVNQKFWLGGLSTATINRYGGQKCSQCDVQDMNFILRAPDDSTTSGWQTMSYSSSAGICGVTDFNKTYTKSYGYTFCPQEGIYDIRVKSNSQG
ncbi:MAG: hypothetical protein V1493_05910, partial [Candidatus Diapherotrites archaeon]